MCARRVLLAAFAYIHLKSLVTQEREREWSSEAVQHFIIYLQQRAQWIGKFLLSKLAPLPKGFEYMYGYIIYIRDHRCNLPIIIIIHGTHNVHSTLIINSINQTLQVHTDVYILYIYSFARCLLRNDPSSPSNESTHTWKLYIYNLSTASLNLTWNMYLMLQNVFTLL